MQIYVTPVLGKTWQLDRKKAFSFVFARYLAAVAMAAGIVSSFFINGVGQVVIIAVCAVTSIATVRGIDSSGAKEIQRPSDHEQKTITWAPLLLFITHMCSIFAVAAYVDVNNDGDCYDEIATAGAAVAVVAGAVAITAATGGTAAVVAAGVALGGGATAVGYSAMDRYGPYIKH